MIIETDVTYYIYQNGLFFVSSHYLSYNMDEGIEFAAAEDAAAWARRNNIVLDDTTRVVKFTSTLEAVSP